MSFSKTRTWKIFWCIWCIRLLSFCVLDRKKSMSERFCSLDWRISGLFWPMRSSIFYKFRHFSRDFDDFLAPIRVCPTRLPSLFLSRDAFFRLKLQFRSSSMQQDFFADLRASHCCVRGRLFYSKADPIGILRMPSFSIREIKVVRFIPKISAAPPLPDILPPQWASTSSM